MIHPPESKAVSQKEKEDPGFLTLCSIRKARHPACCYFQMLDIFKNKSTNAPIGLIFITMMQKGKGLVFPNL